MALISLFESSNRRSFFGLHQFRPRWQGGATRQEAYWRKPLRKLLPSTPLVATLGFVALPSTYWPLLGLILAAYAVLTHLIVHMAWYELSRPAAAGRKAYATLNATEESEPGGHPAERHDARPRAGRVHPRYLRATRPRRDALYQSIAIPQQKWQSLGATSFPQVLATLRARIDKQIRLLVLK